MNRRKLYFVFYSSLTVFFIWLSLKDLTITDFYVLKQKLSRLPLHFNLALLSFILLSNFLRSVRWVLLAGTNSPRISIKASYQTIMISFGVSLIIPFGAEISKPIVLSKLSSVPVPKSISLVAIDRIFDALVFSALLIFSLTRHYNKLLILIPDSYGMSSSTIISILIAVAFSLLCFLIILIVSSKVFLFRLPFLPKIITKKLTKLYLAFTDLKQFIKSPARTFFIILLSILIWSCFFFLNYILLIVQDTSSTYNINFLDAVSFTIICSISFLLTPNGIGSYQYFATKVLTLFFGLSFLEASFHAFVSFILTFLGTNIIGFVILILTIGLKQYKNLTYNG